MRTEPSGHIWRSAQQFFEAAEHIWNDNNIDLNEYVYPLIVNYAFSCELSLKASESKVKFSEVSPDGHLSAINTESSVRGHDLHVIFTNLKPESQRMLKSYFVEVTGNELVPQLQKCAKYFENGRYGYEQAEGTYDISSVRKLAKGLLNALLAYSSKNDYSLSKRIL